MGGELLIIIPAINYPNEGGEDMERMTFRKSFLLSGILLFSVLVLGQLGWACDEPDHPHDQCTEEPDIKKVKVDYDKDIIYIYGKNFTEGTYDPVVTLGDLRLTPLPGFSFTDNELRVIFPEIEAGDYKLTVVTGETRHCRDKQSVKIAHDNEPSCPPAPTCPPTCPEGPKGDKGDKGEKGDTGPKGPQGEQGIQGIQGEKGATGDTGSQGQVGPQGVAGPMGPMGFMGPAGPQGEIGPQGPIGATGSAGPQGPQGLKGDTGATGAAGAQGLVGPIGPPGPKGDQGPQGLQGLQGIQGEKGDKGDTGPQGPIGLTGVGAVGPAGPAGPQGEIGPQGNPGTNGTNGLPGISNYNKVEELDTYNAAAIDPITGFPIGGLPGGLYSKTAACEYNQKLLGGGGGITLVVPYKSYPPMIYNGPVRLRVQLETVVEVDGWMITWHNDYEPGLITRMDTAVYAICADVL